MTKVTLVNKTSGLEKKVPLGFNFLVLIFGFLAPLSLAWFQWVGIMLVVNVLNYISMNVLIPPGPEHALGVAASSFVMQMVANFLFAMIFNKNYALHLLESGNAPASAHDAQILRDHGIQVSLADSGDKKVA